MKVGDVSIPKHLSALTKADWVAFRWVDITADGDPERLFLNCGDRSPDEGAKAADDWDKWFPSYRGT